MALTSSAAIFTANHVGGILIGFGDYAGVALITGVTNTTTATASISFGVGSVSGNIGGNVTLSSETNNLSDYFDINGDNYPDILIDDFVQMTKPTGGLFGADDGPGSDGGARTWSNVGKSGVFGWGLSGSASGTYGDAGSSSASTSGTGVVKKRADLCLGKAQVSNSISGNFGKSRSKTQVLWADINGDGLKDIIIFDRKANKWLLFLNEGSQGFNSCRAKLRVV